MHNRSTKARWGVVAVTTGLVLMGCASAVDGSATPDPVAIEQIAAEKVALAEQVKQDKLDERYLELLVDHDLFIGVDVSLKIERGRAICERVRSGEDRPEMLKSLMNQYGIAEGIMFMSDSMDIYCPEELGPK